MVGWSWLTPAHESQLCASLPSSTSSDIMRIAWNCTVGIFIPWISANTTNEGFFKEPVEKHLLEHSQRIISTQKTLAIICNGLFFIRTRIHVLLEQLKQCVDESPSTQTAGSFMGKGAMLGVGVVGGQWWPSAMSALAFGEWVKKWLECGSAQHSWWLTAHWLFTRKHVPGDKVLMALHVPLWSQTGPMKAVSGAWHSLL